MKNFVCSFIVLIIALIGLMSSTGVAGQAVVVPAEVNATDVNDVSAALRAAQALEISWLSAQVSWFELNKFAFESSRVAASGEVIGPLGVGAVVVLDSMMLKRWIAGVGAPSKEAVRAAWVATQGRNAFTQTVARILASVKALGLQSNIVKKVVATAAIGAVSIAQVESFWVVHMSEKQYQKTVALFDVKIASLKAAKAALADTYVPLSISQ